MSDDPTSSNPVDEHDEHDEHDERDERDGEGRRPGPAAAYASNWRTVLLVDGLMGVAVIAAGVLLSIRWNPVGGGFVGSLGFVYVLLVLRRARTWADLRRDLG